MAEPRDLYELLGVPRNATQDEIRKAYRSLARRHHPDVSDSPEAEERFKQIQGAYEILSDPAKRQRYDAFGTSGSAGSPFGDITEIFEMFFGAPFAGRPGPRRTRTQHGEALGVSLVLTFQEAVFGVSRDVKVESLEGCSRCSGSGSEPGTAPSRCSVCGGSGQVQDYSRSIFGTVMTAHPCATCEGTGEQVVSKCTNCAGEGRIARTKTVTVEVPAGVSDGLELRISGAGNAGRAGGGPGDLYVSLRVEPHPVFERRGHDLFSVLEVPMTTAALGGEFDVELLDRTERVSLEPGAESGTVMRVKNGGVPNLGRRGRGDLFLTVQVLTPKPRKKEERQLLQRLAELRHEELTGSTKGGNAPATLRRPRRSE